MRVSSNDSVCLLKVGVACCQIALAHGMRVLATAGSDRGLQMLREQNVTEAFNHNKKGYIKEIQVSFAGLNLSRDLNCAECCLVDLLNA